MTTTVGTAPRAAGTSPARRSRTGGPLDPRLIRYARATAVHLAVLVVLGTATAGLVIVQAGLLADTISGAFLGGRGWAALRGAIGLLALVVAGRVALAWATEAASYRAAAAVKSALRRRLLAHVLQLGPRWLAGRRTGEITALATRGVDALDAYFAKYLPQLVLAVLVPTAVLLRILPADLTSAVTIALTLPLIPVFMALVGLHTRAQTARRWRALARLSHHFVDVVAGLPTLKVFGRARAQAQNVRRISDDYRRATLATLRTAFLSSLVLELLATLSVALVAVGIGLRLVRGGLDLRTALLVLVLAPEAYLPLRQVGAHFHASADGLAAAEEVFAILETPAAPAGRRTDVPHPRVVRVEHVGVAHPERGAPAPDDVSLTVAAGEVVALAGPSGCGKSTLVGVLLGFVRPDTGRVLVSGPGTADPVDLADLDPTAWRTRVAWVPQDPVLVPGTIADNIRLSRPDATPAEVAAAAREAALHEIALDTRIGERGAGLSVGQRRRVALARAFLRCGDGTPRLLLLDEPTAGLDAATEAAVLAAVRRAATAGHAVLVVAHRPSVLAAADRVVTLATREAAA